MAFRVCPENFARALVVAEFLTVFSKKFPPSTKITVAVVGGSKDEPEVRALKALGVTVETRLFGIEKGMTFHDLNESHEDAGNSREFFDLVLCSQVWEHLWDHAAAFKNLQRLMSSQTCLWLACPASNRAHGSPSYFAAGFTAEYLCNNLARSGMSIVSSGQLGSSRNYRALHTMPTWLSVKGHEFPPLWAFSGQVPARKILLTIRFFARTLELLLFSPRVTDDMQCATESWACAQKRPVDCEKREGSVRPSLTP